MAHLLCAGGWRVHRQICDCVCTCGQAAAVSRWEVAPCQVPVASPQSVVMRKVPRASSREILSLWSGWHFTDVLSVIRRMPAKEAVLPHGHPGISGTVGTGWQVKRKGTSHGRRSRPVLQTERVQRYAQGCLTVYGMLGTNLETIAPRSRYHQYHPDKWEDAPRKLQLWCGWKSPTDLCSSQVDNQVTSSFKFSLSP